MYSRVLILMLMILTFPMAANATEPINTFEIQVIPAEQQQNFSQGYFNVDSKPGQTLSLNFRVTNNGEKTIQLSAQAVDAYTANKGGILYGLNRDAADDQILLSDLLEIQDTVTVAPGEFETVHFHIAIPAAASGTLLGGIMLTADKAAEDLTVQTENKVGSNYSFERVGQRLVAVQLNLPEKSTSEFSLGKVKFNDEKNLLTMRIANAMSVVLERVQGTYTILDYDGTEILTGAVEPFAMAPISTIKFPIDLKGQVLEPGKYVVMIKGRADEKEFFAEEKFSVSGKEQESVVGESTETLSAMGPRENISRTIAIGLVVLFLLLPLILKIKNRKENPPYWELSDKNNL